MTRGSIAGRRWHYGTWTVGSRRRLTVNLSEASPALREFYELHCVDTILPYRHEEDWGFASRLTPAELALARRLVRANRHPGQLYLDSAAVLNDREAIPELHWMLDQAKNAQ